MFLLLIAAMIGSNARAEDVILIKAEGVAQRTNDIAEAKKNALNDAIKNAVTQAANSLSAMAANEPAKAEAVASALSDTKRFILNYKILSEATGLAGAMQPAQGAAGPEPTGMEQGAETLHIWIELTINAAQLKQALGLAAPIETQSLKSIKITVLDVVDYGTFSLILSALNDPAFAREVQYNSFLRGRINLTIKTTEDAMMLKQNLSALLTDALAAAVGNEREVIIRPAQKGEPVK